MVDILTITYSIGRNLETTLDPEPVDGVNYYKWGYQEISYPDQSKSPFDEAWFELDSETGLYGLTDDTEVNAEKTYYTYELILQDPEEGDNPSELGWLVISEPEVIGEPSSTVSLAYDA